MSYAALMDILPGVLFRAQGSRRSKDFRVLYQQTNKQTNKNDKDTVPIYIQLSLDKILSHDGKHSMWASLGSCHSTTGPVQVFGIAGQIFCLCKDQTDCNKCGYVL